MRSSLVKQINLIDERHSILECEDGSKALEILKEKHDELQLAIIDNQMPGLNGSDVIRNIREFENLNHLKQIPILCKLKPKKFLVLTGDNDEEILVEAMNYGANYLCKLYRIITNYSFKAYSSD